MNKDIVLFTSDDKEVITLEKLFKRIYENHENKQAHILSTAKDLQPMIKRLSDAVTLMPLLIQLQESSIKNDDALIKLAAIVQRMQSKVKAKDDNGEFGFSASMREELIKAAKEYNNLPGSSASG